MSQAFLDGIWLRAVSAQPLGPSLSDLIAPAAQRPKTFFRGYEAYDPTKLGFVASGAEAERAGTRYETSAKGIGNQGHEFGAPLSDADKRALLEYPKTL